MCIRPMNTGEGQLTPSLTILSSVAAPCHSLSLRGTLGKLWVRTFLRPLSHAKPVMLKSLFSEDGSCSLVR